MTGIKIKLQGFELKALRENGVLIKPVPYIRRDGTPTKVRIPIKIFPDNIDPYGVVEIRREGGRIKPKRRRFDMFEGLI